MIRLQICWFWSGHCSKEFILLVTHLPEVTNEISSPMEGTLCHGHVFVNLFEVIGRCIQWNVLTLSFINKWLQEMEPVGNSIMPRSSDDSVTDSSPGMTSGLLTDAQPTVCPVPKPCLPAFSLSSWEGSSKCHPWLRWPELFPLLVTGTVIPPSPRIPTFLTHSENHSHAGKFLLHSSELGREWEKWKASLLLCLKRIRSRWGRSEY